MTDAIVSIRNVTKKFPGGVVAVEERRLDQEAQGLGITRDVVGAAARGEGEGAERRPLPR